MLNNKSDEEFDSVNIGRKSKKGNKKMTDLGMKKDKIRKALKKNKIANWERVSQGLFTPVKIPDEIVKQVNFAQDDYGGDKVDTNLLGQLRSKAQERRLSTKTDASDPSWSSLLSK